MDAALAVLIGTFGGAAIGFAGSIEVSSIQRQADAQAEQRRAFARFLDALYPAVEELREMPPQPRAQSRKIRRRRRPCL